ncbi:MAG: YhjD/YihY/BrkB family envelope integrity protein [Phycisphaerales bacterium]
MSRLTQLLARLAYGIRHPEEEATRLQRFIRESYFFVRFCAARLAQHRAPQLASALSYRTIFSIIPLLALSLVMVRGIYGEEGIRHGLRAVMEFTGISELAIVTEAVEGDGHTPGATAAPASATAASAAFSGMQFNREGEPIGAWGGVRPGKGAFTAFVWSQPNSALRGAEGGERGQGGTQGGAAGRDAVAGAGSGAEAGGNGKSGGNGGNGRSASEIRAEGVAEWVERFVDNLVVRLSGINLRWITLVAVGVFIYAAISLLIQIEDAFNAVTNARSGRSIVARVTTYWTLLTLGSLALVASFVVGEAYERTLAALPSWMEFVRPTISILTKVGVSWLLLLFAYAQMPNTRVKLKCAAIGAIVAAVLWETGKGGLGWFLREMTGGQVAVYGSLALLPLFLLWVYITWLIVLFGLELAHAIQTVGPERREMLFQQKTGSVQDPLVGIAALREVALRFDDGRISTMPDIADALGLPEHIASRIIQRLVDHNILLNAVKGAEEEGLSLALPAERIRLRDVAERAFPLSITPSSARGIASLRDAQLRALGGLSLADVLHDDPLSPAPSRSRLSAAPADDPGAGSP